MTRVAFDRLALLMYRETLTEVCRKSSLRRRYNRRMALRDRLDRLLPDGIPRYV